VFELSPPAKKGKPWSENILYSFLGGYQDGQNPSAGVIMDKSGNLYGTTQAGGANDIGTVFEVVP